MTDLWVEASRDYDREDADLRLSRAKVAVSSLWPFLSLAKTAAEFEQRLDLAQDTIAMRVEAGMLDLVNDSLREDFGIVTTGTLRTVASQHPEEVVPWHVHQGSQEGELWDNLDEPVVAKTASAVAGPPTRPVGEPPKYPVPRQMQIYSLATKSWITIEAADPDTRGNPNANPYYFDEATEEGPHTGETGMYPVAPAGPDPISPLQSEYPMQPSAWVPNNAWVERPMQFGTKSAANEHYFDGGTEGVEGDSQTGFPADVSLPEEDERVDFYGTVPPVHASRHVAIKEGDIVETTEHHVDPNGTEIKAGTRSKVHKVYGPEDDYEVAISHNRVRPHEWGYMPQDKLKVVGSIQAEAEYHYVKPSDDGNGYDVIQKGTGKVLSHHDTKELAEASFRAMMWSKHSGSKASPDFRDGSGASVRVLADLGDNPYSGTDNTAMDSPVTPPPAMMGGPGSQAIDTNTTSPSDQAAKNARRLTAAEVMERPTAENPSGVADEYDANTWEGYNAQRPRQLPEQRGINTPQRPREPIRQNTSSGMAGEDEEEGNEREAALHVAAWAVFHALEGIAA